MKVILYHNPRCSKSRQTLALLKEKGLQVKIIEYLKQPPDITTLKKLLAKLGFDPGELVRPREAREAGIDHLSGDALLKALAENPKALQRPIALIGDKAVLGRPPENILKLLPDFTTLQLKP